MNNFVFGTHSKEKLEGTKNMTKRLAALALKISNVDFGITSGFRTVDEQYKIFLEGNSECDGTKEVSAHQLGLAVDVLAYTKDTSGRSLDGYNQNHTMVRLAYMEIGRAFLRAGRMMGINVEWGITYNIGSGYDVYHFQINI